MVCVGYHIALVPPETDSWLDCSFHSTLSPRSAVNRAEHFKRCALRFEVFLSATIEGIFIWGLFFGFVYTSADPGVSVTL